LKVVLMPMERERDLPIAEAIAYAMSCDAVVMRGRYNVNAVIGMLARMRLIVAMRLHALVFGAGQGVPVIGISYDDKVSRFMDYIGRELCIAYDECNYEKLKSYIDIALRDEAISQKLRESTKLIRENERANVRAAKEFFK
ncbi:MAG: polysaccharide pyruvyl transferase family protein, partial [Clostridia bacterium]